MDPITQSAVGAAAAQISTRHARYLYAAVFGALGGMAPDLDVLVRSGSDPLLALQYHRQFTHSLFAIPVLGGLCGLLAYGLLGRRWPVTLKQAMLWSVAGYATHGLLDGCTSYGTQLLWPLSNRRFSLDLVSVVDPLFTLPILVFIALAVARRSARWPWAAAGWAVFYLGVGAIQHERALDMGREIAAQRGHSPLRLEAKPSFGNLVVWKVVYETGDRFFVDAVKPGIFSPVVWPGDSLAKVAPQKAFPWLNAGSRQWRDIERFADYSSGYVAVDPRNPLRLFDVRYSMLPDRIEPMWGIALSPDKSADEHVEYFTQREDGAQAAGRLLEMIVE